LEKSATSSDGDDQRHVVDSLRGHDTIMLRNLQLKRVW
jgi:hypothetical protein